jgi:hypothetical protein
MSDKERSQLLGPHGTAFGGQDARRRPRRRARWPYVPPGVGGGAGDVSDSSVQSEREGRRRGRGVEGREVDDVERTRVDVPWRGIRSGELDPAVVVLALSRR